MICETFYQEDEVYITSVYLNIVEECEVVSGESRVETVMERNIKLNK